jgi:hypothetical protein
MSRRIKLDDGYYDGENLSDEAKKIVIEMQFATEHLKNLKNMQALLRRAKNSYLESLRKEILAEKAGLFFE